MVNYIDANLKNTRYLMSKNTSERYERLYKNRYEVQINIFGKYVDKDKPLLDIGIREGAFLEVLSGHGFKKLYGIDIFEDGVEMASKKGFKCKVVDAHYFDLNIKFGTIIISHVLEHCPEPSKVLERVYEHLLEDGILFVEVPRETDTICSGEKDAHYYNFESLDSLLSLFDDRWEILEELIQGKNDCRLKIVAKKRGS